VSCFTASRPEKRFESVEEMASCVMRFSEERLASFTCSFGASDVSSYRVIGTLGSLRVDHAYEYAEEITHQLTIDGKTRERTFAKRDQFGPELVHFSQCVIDDRQPEPSGLEGLADVRIIEALYRSAAKDGKAIRVDAEAPARRPSLATEIRRPAVERPSLVHATSPSGEEE
jgi:glucose-fructose oxidoreductase